MSVGAGKYLTGCRGVSAFTLFELLTAVAVAATLGAILATAYKSMVDGARTVKCMGNLRAIGGGIISYANDRNGYLWTREEIGFSKYRQSLDPLGLPQILKEYVSLDAWVCPDVRPVLKDYRNGYTWSISSDFTGDFVEPGTQLQKSIFAADNLDDQDIIWDAFNYTSPSLFNRWDDKKGDGSTGPTTSSSIRPHRRKKMANFVSLDGHVETR